MANLAEAYGLDIEFDSTDFFLAGKVEAWGLDIEYDSTFTVFDSADLYSITAEYDGTFTVFDSANLYNTALELAEIPKISYQPLDISSIDGTQSIVDPSGSTDITLSWSIQSISEYHPGEYLGLIRDAVSVFEFWTKYRDVVDSIANSALIYEAYHDSVSYETTMTSDATAGCIRLNVDDSSIIPIYSWIKIVQGDGHPSEFNRITAISANEIKLQYPITKYLPTNLTIAKVWVNEMTITTDYTINTSTGYIQTIAGQFTNGSEAFIRYKYDKIDIDHFELWRVTGTNIEEYGAIYSDVTSSPTAVAINESISSSTTSYNINFTTDQNGAYYTLYLYSVDSDGNKSLAKRAFVETIPSKVTSLSGSSDSVTGDMTITFSSSTGPAPNGVNIYRCVGAWDAATATKINSIVVTSSQFIDGPSNSTNRVSSGTAPYPTSGNGCRYKFERIDSVTDWDTGTQNSIGGSSQIDAANKNQEAAPEVIPPGWTDIPV